MPTRRPTYERFVIHTIMPATGWLAVYWDAAHQHHDPTPIEALALVERREYDAERQTRRRCAYEEHPEEYREVVGMQYYLSDGWSICDEASNYCGLIPPGATLADFEQAQGCQHGPSAAAPPAPASGP